MTGEWLFAPAAFGDQAPTEGNQYLDLFPSEAKWAQGLGLSAAALSELRLQTLPQFVDSLLVAYDWQQYDVIGFTSTFQQNTACLALATRLKEHFPSITVIFGGANMEDCMGVGYMRAFECIDYVIRGEAEASLPTLLAKLSDGLPGHDLAGVIGRAGGELVDGGQRAPIGPLDQVPSPEYDDFYRQASALGLRPSGYLPVESSRGCWWGAKHHCTFCGLNGNSIAFRAKSPERFGEELAGYSRRYLVTHFEATDNIVDMHYVEDFFRQLGDARIDYQFFYEVKANLTLRQLRTLHRGGVRRLQPGIESLSSHVLGLMRKGSNMLQNVRMLKWCKYLGIQVNWNLIFGFPGETQADYEAQLAVLRLLSHLQPPSGPARIWLERFSPYFVDRVAFPVSDVVPERSYLYVYPATVNLESIAYFFDYSMGDTVDAEVHYSTEDWVGEWGRRATEAPDFLSFRQTSDGLLVDDSRGLRTTTFDFTGTLGEIYLACTETMRSPRRVLDTVTCRTLTEREVRGALQEFCAAGLMVQENDSFLGLALPVNPDWREFARGSLEA